MNEHTETKMDMGFSQEGFLRQQKRNYFNSRGSCPVKIRRWGEKGVKSIMM